MAEGEAVTEDHPITDSVPDEELRAYAENLEQDNASLRKAVIALIYNAEAIKAALQDSGLWSDLP